MQFKTIVQQPKNETKEAKSTVLFAILFYLCLFLLFLKLRELEQMTLIQANTAQVHFDSNCAFTCVPHVAACTLGNP